MVTFMFVLIELDKYFAYFDIVGITTGLFTVILLCKFQES